MFSNDDITAIELSYWRRREFPTLSMADHGRIGCDSVYRLEVTQLILACPRVWEFWWLFGGLFCFVLSGEVTFFAWWMGWNLPWLHISYFHLYTALACSLYFYTVICWNQYLKKINWLRFRLSILGVYFNDGLIILCDIALMDLRCDQAELNFNSCWMHGVK